MAAFVFRCKCEKNWCFFCINPVTGWIEILPTLWYVDSKFICFEKTYPATSEKFYNISRYKMNILYWQCGSIENVIERYVAICYLTAPSNLPEPVLTLDFWYSCQCDFIARTHGCARNDSETHETALLDCTTGEAGSAIQQHQSSAFHCHFAHTRAFSLLSHTYWVQTELSWFLSNEFNTKKLLVVTYFSNSQFVPYCCWVLVKRVI